MLRLAPPKSHFTSIGPAVASLAAQINSDTGPTPEFPVSRLSLAR